MLFKDERLCDESMPSMIVLELLMGQQQGCPPGTKLRSTAFSRMGLLTLLEYHFCMEPPDPMGERPILSASSSRNVARHVRVFALRIMKSWMPFDRAFLSHFMSHSR